MCSKGVIVGVALLMMQIYGVLSCTFTVQEEDFLADTMYEMPKENKDMCFRTCFEESNCTFVSYREVVVADLFAASLTAEEKHDRKANTECCDVVVGGRLYETIPYA
ncbi:unnamed protein product [Cylicocyclus nassatus]|uniref:PAN-3 domain-containing protein n=1 Tax=Cylicocyclus nassatus TaxID=53992 RepID=A0AA36GNZ6_CYLNA|nr:unnamed protein product [Cylicocyclus nassatus]